MRKYQIHLVSADGQSAFIQAEGGSTLRDAALGASVAGIVGSCGGAMMCGTCHVYVDDKDLSRAGKPSEDEEAIFEALSLRAEVKPSSRLSCQIIVSEALDNLTVHLPKSQPGV